MDRQEIESKVNEIIVETLDVKPDMVSADADLKNDLCCDSLEYVELVMKLEDELGISISDEAAEKCETVNDMYDIVEELVK